MGARRAEVLGWMVLGLMSRLEHEFQYLHYSVHSDQKDLEKPSQIILSSPKKKTISS